jgi:hypothetical protein
VRRSLFLPIEDVSTIDVWTFLPLYKGMSDKTLITNLIDEWKPRKSLAEQIKANPDAVHKWARFNRIPSEWQAQVVSAAQSKGLSHITADWMLDAHSREART